MWRLYSGRFRGCVRPESRNRMCVCARLGLRRVRVSLLQSQSQHGMLSSVVLAISISTRHVVSVCGVVFAISISKRHVAVCLQYRHETRFASIALLRGSRGPTQDGICTHDTIARFSMVSFADSVSTRQVKSLAVTALRLRLQIWRVIPVVNGRPEIEFANMTQLLRRGGRNRDEFANMAQANDMPADRA